MKTPSTKFSYDFVRAEVEKRGGSLISEEYLGCYQKLEILGNCGHRFRLRYSKVRAGHWCQKCTKEKANAKIRFSYDFVQELVFNKGGKLLSKTYENTRQKLEILCGCGEIFFHSLSAISIGCWCSKCKNDKKTQKTVDCCVSKIEPMLAPAKIVKFHNKKQIDVLCVCGEYCRVTYLMIVGGNWCLRCIKNKKIQKFTEVIESKNCTVTSYCEKDNSLEFDVRCVACGAEEKNVSEYSVMNRSFMCLRCFSESQRMKNLKHTPDTIINGVNALGFDVKTINEFCGSNTVVVATCKVCSAERKTRFGKFLESGCKKCAQVEKAMSLEEVSASASAAGLELLSKNYINSGQKLNVRCKKCLIEFTSTYGRIRLGTGCVKCKNWKKSKSQTKLYNYCKEIFPGEEVVMEFSEFDWLKTYKGGKQSFDIFIKTRKIAIEYDGEQHFIPIDYFGGQENLDKVRRLDMIKNKKVQQHPDDICYFVRFNYMEKVTKEYVIEKLLAAGVII